MVDFQKDAETGDANEVVRQQSWPAEGPAELELTIDVGRIRVDLQDSEEGEVRVEVRHDPTAGNSWTQGISGIISWIGNATGGAVDLGQDSGDLARAAVQAAEISWSEGSRRLVVRSSEELPLRVVPLAVTVWAPAQSRLAARTGAGEVRVTGLAAWAGVRTGSGRITVEAVSGDADLTTGSGEVEVGSIGGRARVRTGSGGVRLDRQGGPTEVKASSGDVTLGEVHADLAIRTGSGDVEITDAHAGDLEITTGSGELRVGVHPGVRAELDLSCGSGRARSDLEINPVAPEGAPTLRIKGRTGSGDVLVRRAMVPA